jgi:hypothetical protein
MYGMLTTGKPVLIVSKTACDKPTHYFEIANRHQAEPSRDHQRQGRRRRHSARRQGAEAHRRSRDRLGRTLSGSDPAQPSRQRRSRSPDPAGGPTASTGAAAGASAAAAGDKAAGDKAAGDKAAGDKAAGDKAAGGAAAGNASAGEKAAGDGADAVRAVDTPDGMRAGDELRSGTRVTIELEGRYIRGRGASTSTWSKPRSPTRM